MTFIYAPALRYVGGELRSDDVSLASVAENFGTPTYVYSEPAIERAFFTLRDALEEHLGGRPYTICYAVKANTSGGVLRTLQATGDCGADIVSGGELERALRAGFEPRKIVFSGVGKSDEELRRAIDVGIGSIHAESEHEVHRIGALAAELGIKARISLRVNPDVDPQTHPYISTGLHGTKFGMTVQRAESLLPWFAENSQVTLEGVACHIGSQVKNPSAMRDALALLGGFVGRARDAGLVIRSIDAGGGWPVHYGNETTPFPPPATFVQMIDEGLSTAGIGTETHVYVEPGRSLVAAAGVLLTRVVRTRHQGKKKFVVVDAAMNDLIRPALYDAYHHILPIRENQEAGLDTADVVGPICESGDFIARDRELPPMEVGELAVICGAGAYGMTMASNYNSRPLPAEVMTRDGEVRLITRRQQIDELWARELV